MKTTNKTGRHITPEHKQKLSDAMKTRWRERPMKRTEEHKRKLSEGMTLFWKRIKDLQEKNDMNK